MNSDSMIFVDKSLDDSIINLLKIMLDHHINRKYEELRQIIMGYDSKNDQWLCKYGQALDNRLNGYFLDYTTSNNDRYRNTNDQNNNTGMIFYEDELYKHVKFHMDESVKRILYVLFNISNNVIDRRYLIDIIISDWNLKNMSDSLSPMKIDNVPDICGDLYFHQLEVRTDAWTEFKKIIKKKGMTIRDGFKQAIISFLENRLPIVDNMNINELMA